MKTDELVALLANRIEPVDSRMAARRYALAIGGGAIAAIAGTIAVLGVNPGLARETSESMFWAREAFCLAVGIGGFAAITRLARPGVSLGRLPAAVSVPLIALWLLAAIALLAAPGEDRIPLLLGRTARVCPFRIAVIASPMLVAFIWALRGLAPTRLRLAGAAAGLAAGAFGALIYTLHCPELAAPFLAVWYVLGILAPTAVGAALGPRLLRW